MGKPIPTFVDDQGHLYHSVAAGVRLIGADLICEATLWNYAKKGHHPCGLDLGVIQFPLLRSSPNRPRSDRQFRFMIREDRLLVLRELLHDYRPPHGGQWSEATLKKMREDARCRLNSLPTVQAIRL